MYIFVRDALGTPLNEAQGPLAFWGYRQAIVEPWCSTYEKGPFLNWPRSPEELAEDADCDLMAMDADVEFAAEDGQCHAHASQWL